jgi:hypothetical protein
MAIATAVLASALLLRLMQGSADPGVVGAAVGLMATVGLVVNLTLVLQVVLKWRHFRPLR